MSQANYEALMEVVRSRMTVRAFDPSHAVPREHYEMILEAARHAPSGANAQPWHFIVVTEQALKDRIMEYFRQEQVARAKLKMKFPTPDYRGLATAPGFIVIASDFRWVRAFPVLNDGSELDRMYKENAERILLQSVAAATMSAHLAAAALDLAFHDRARAVTDEHRAKRSAEHHERGGHVDERLDAHPAHSLSEDDDNDAERRHCQRGDIESKEPAGTARCHYATPVCGMRAAAISSATVG